MDERAKVRILKREYIWVFFGKFRVVLVCFGLLRNSSVCFGCFDIGSKHRNKPKYLVFGFTIHTETNVKQILFRFVSVPTHLWGNGTETRFAPFHFQAQQTVLYSVIQFFKGTMIFHFVRKDYYFQFGVKIINATENLFESKRI